MARRLPRAQARAKCLALCLAAVGMPAAGWAAADRAEPSSASEVLMGQPPPAGQYDAVLCVTVGSTPPNCGPVRADIGPAGQALVRVSDIAYRLEIHADQLGVTLFHGTMQIDGFFAPYRWTAYQLQFSDPEKATRYEVRLGTRRFDGP
jgi:hypothetical protein